MRMERSPIVAAVLVGIVAGLVLLGGCTGSGEMRHREDPSPATAASEERHVAAAATAVEGARAATGEAQKLLEQRPPAVPPAQERLGQAQEHHASALYELTLARMDNAKLQRELAEGGKYTKQLEEWLDEAKKAIGERDEAIRKMKADEKAAFGRRLDAIAIGLGLAGLAAFGLCALEAFVLRATGTVIGITAGAGALLVAGSAVLHWWAAHLVLVEFLVLGAVGLGVLYLVVTRLDFAKVRANFGRLWTASAAVVTGIEAQAEPVAETVKAAIAAAAGEAATEVKTTITGLKHEIGLGAAAPARVVTPLEKARAMARSVQAKATGPATVSPA